MKNLLETVIRTVLFEQRGVGKIQRIALSQSEMQQAKASGAVFAYKVITRNATTDKARLDLIKGATLASINSDESRTAVGASSQFANGKYVYVVDPAVGDGKRQVSLVRIFPVLPETIDKVKTDASDQNVVVIANRIGKSRMMTLQGYQIELQTYDKQAPKEVDVDKYALDRLLSTADNLKDKLKAELDKNSFVF